MSHDPGHTKSLIDGVAMATAFTNIMSWLPPLLSVVAAGLTIVWTLLRIYDWIAAKRAAKSLEMTK